MIESFFWFEPSIRIYHYTKILREVTEGIFEVVELTIYGDVIYESRTTYPQHALNRQKKKSVNTIMFIRAVIDNMFTSDHFKYVILYDSDDKTTPSQEIYYER